MVRVVCSKLIAPQGALFSLAPGAIPCFCSALPTHPLRLGKLLGQLTQRESLKLVRTLARSPALGLRRDAANMEIVSKRPEPRKGMMARRAEANRNAIEGHLRASRARAISPQDRIATLATESDTGRSVHRRHQGRIASGR
jgi:hypothetical protein